MPVCSSTAEGGWKMERCVWGRGAALAWSAVLLATTRVFAQGSAIPPVTVGAGVQTSFVHDMPEGGKATSDFLLNSVRLYVNGSATSRIKFMFNTEYDGTGNHVTVLD